jgi:hypothetical protein
MAGREDDGAEFEAQLIVLDSVDAACSRCWYVVRQSKLLNSSLFTSSY